MSSTGWAKDVFENYKFQFLYQSLGHCAVQTLCDFQALDVQWK